MKPKIFKTFVRKGVKYLVFPRYPGYYVIDEYGNNYGVFSDIRSFSNDVDKWKVVGKSHLDFRTATEAEFREMTMFKWD